MQICRYATLDVPTGDKFMTYAITYSRAAVGIQAPLITVEADTTSGLSQIIIVGLPETAVKESKDRVKTAIINAGYSLPNKRLTVNLSPADLPKSGGRCDLAVALCILVAAGNLPEGCLKDFEFLGELALNGETRFVSGILPVTMQNMSTVRSLVVPTVNSSEAALVEPTAKVFAASSLQDVIAHLLGRESLALVKSLGTKVLPINTLELSDVRGQNLAKRALKIAAGGGHNLLFIGPPGSGKTMLASRLGSLLPTMSIEDAISTASVQSVSKYQFNTTTFGVRPFRTPHHTASAVALVGGGNPPRPGEISLAHNGVLFLDELPEYPRHVLEALREPIESGEIIISQAHHQVCFPANFQLIAVMNPCPCGYYGDNTDRCDCTNDKILKYRSRVSGPLLDRIYLHLDVPALPPGRLSEPNTTNSFSDHKQALARVANAQSLMLNRFGKLNAALTNKEIESHCRLTPNDLRLLDKAMLALGLSARGYYKILKVARTIADIEESTDIHTKHLTEALGLRKLDRYQAV